MSHAYPAIPPRVFPSAPDSRPLPPLQTRLAEGLPHRTLSHIHQRIAPRTARRTEYLWAFIEPVAREGFSKRSPSSRSAVQGTLAKRYC